MKHEAANKLGDVSSQHTYDDYLLEESNYSCHHLDSRIVYIKSQAHIEIMTFKKREIGDVVYVITFIHSSPIFVTMHVTTRTGQIM